MIILSGPNIYTEDRVIEQAALAIHNDKIHAIDTQKNFSSSDHIITFPDTYHIVPGFIDVHIHGANGQDVMDGNLDALTTISRALAMEGTTSYLATTMTASSEKISKVVKNVSDYQKTQQKIDGAQVLGVHLEGPFLSPEKAGAQNAKDILIPRIDYIREWQKISNNAIKLVTLAPELPNSHELIRFLLSENIIASIGHTNATYAETLAAINAGCSHVTHLFNAMRGIHQREPGVVTAALLSENVSTEVILDGHHLHPAIVELIFKIKNKDKLILVTDAMRAKCLREGAYDLGGQTVHVKNNVAALADGTLAGSVLTMCSAIKNLMQFTQCSLSEAVFKASTNPAKLLNIYDKKGSIAPTKDADVVVLDHHFNVVLTIVRGKIVYQTKI